MGGWGAKEVKRLMAKEKTGISGGRKEYRGTLSFFSSIMNLKFLIYQASMRIIWGSDVQFPHGGSALTISLKVWKLY